MNTILSILKRKNGVMTEGTAAEGSFCVPMTDGTEGEGFAMMVPLLFEATPGLDTWKLESVLSNAPHRIRQKQSCGMRNERPMRQQGRRICAERYLLQSPGKTQQCLRHADEVPRTIPDCYCSQAVMPWLGVEWLNVSCCGSCNPRSPNFLNYRGSTTEKHLKKSKFFTTADFHTIPRKFRHR